MLSSFAVARDIYSFDTPIKQYRFDRMTAELRCLVCQNESLADSNAGLAKDLRAEIYDKIQRGYEDAAIKQYLLQRYGEFILFKPALNHVTLFLWTFPFILLVIGFAGLFFMMKHRKKLAAPLFFSEEEQQRFQRLMK